MALRAVLFDAGGTLINPDYGRVAGVLRNVLARAPDADAFVAAEYAGRDAVEAAMAQNGGRKDRDRWVLHFGAMFGALGYTGEEIAKVAPHVVAEHRAANLWTVPQPGAVDALAALRRAGFIVGVVSNADGTVDQLLAGAGFAPHLAFVVDSGAVGIEKPDPRIFDLALGLAGVSAAETLYVGDLYPVDVVGARRAGIEPVLLDPLGRYGARDCRTARDVPTLCRELVAAQPAR
ncbi:MAG: HAD-IA family hydrolase [Gemmatimonadales bacterium]|jgi:putative hydrolase of the HAD superfamily